MKTGTSCESCGNYVYDDEYDCYECQINLDEDEMVRFLSNSEFCCPYYQLDNEYKIVNKQI